MRTASSAERTWSDAESSSGATATVEIPSSRQAWKTRSAILGSCSQAGGEPRQLLAVGWALAREPLGRSRRLGPRLQDLADL
jgi:hypothetical protein